MAILNELYEIAALGADPSFREDEGLRVGFMYSALMRKELFDGTRTRPLPQDAVAFAEALEGMERNLWQSRSEEKVTAPSRSLFQKGSRPPKDWQSVPAAATAAAATPVGDEACILHGVIRCGQKSCKRSHECPYCSGAMCSNRAGYLEFHLAQLKNPRYISAVAPDGGFGHSAGTGKYRQQPRPRSLSTRRGGFRGVKDEASPS